MATSMTTVRLPDDLREKLADLAARQDRPVGYLVTAAVRRMVADHEAIAALADQGLADLDAGRVMDHADVMRRGEAILKAAGKPA